MRVGNISLVTEAQMAPVSHPDLAAMFRAAGIAGIGRSTFQRISQQFVWPTVREAYQKQQTELLQGISEPVQISIDSPGYSAELCAVTAIESTSNQVLAFSVVHKSEVDNTSGRMELLGVKKCLGFLESKVRIESITTYKHAQVCCYLRSKGYAYYFDPWHMLKSTHRKIRAAIKDLKDESEKAGLKELGKRFIVHIYSAVEKSCGDPSFCKESAFSFFLHVQGIHRWDAKKLCELISVEASTKIGQKFTKECFKSVLSCSHQDSASKHPPVHPASKVFQILLGIAAKTQFVNDLERLRHGNFTSFVESFHSVVIRYRPKRKFYPLTGFEGRTMLAAMAFNENRRAEKRGERTVQSHYECYSKAKGMMRIKFQKGPVSDRWKAKIVEESVQRKTTFNESENVPQEILDDGIIDVIADTLENLLVFDVESDGETEE